VPARHWVGGRPSLETWAPLRDLLVVDGRLTLTLPPMSVVTLWEPVRAPRP